MRPPGEIRLAMRSAAASFGADGATWRDMAAKACVGWEAARSAKRDMVKSGELVVRDFVRVPGVCRPMAVLALAEDSAAPSSHAGALDAVVRSWAEFR